MPLAKPDLIKTRTCADAFGQIFFAFIFFLDLRVGGVRVRVDLLPDVIGWIMVASALGRIFDLHTEIPKLRTLAFILVFLSLFDLVQFRIRLSSHVFIQSTFPFKAIVTALDVLFFWRLCGVIMDMAAAVRNALIYERADMRRILYVVALIAAFILVGISVAFPPFATIALLVGIPLSLIAFFLMMGLMHGVRNMCLGKPVYSIGERVDNPRL